MAPCYIWNTKSEIFALPHAQRVNSPRAGGSYEITDSAVPMLAPFNIMMKRSLTDYIVEQNRFGTVPSINSTNLKEIIDRPSPTVHARAINLIRHLRQKSAAELGAPVAFVEPEEDDSASTHRYLLAHTSSLTTREIVVLASFCADERWISHKAQPLLHGGFRHELVLQPLGFKYLDDIDGVGLQSDQGFIAMWFDPSMDRIASDGIGAGIEDAGYKAVRIDKKEHADKIDDQIIAEIRRSRFVVADFTSEPHKPRGGVYYEAGFARGIGIPVIWTCREDFIAQVHFDTRQFNHILWKTPEELRAKLAVRISAVIGDGPHRKSS